MGKELTNLFSSTTVQLYWYPHIYILLLKETLSNLVMVFIYNVHFGPYSEINQSLFQASFAAVRPNEAFVEECKADTGIHIPFL